jgi:hypothetical protein
MEEGVGLFFLITPHLSLLTPFYWLRAEESRSA